MSLRKGLVRAGRTLDSPRQKSLGGVIPTMTLDNPAGWISGEESVAMSRDKAMKVSTVNRCVEVLSTSMAVLPVYTMNESTKERLPDHPLQPMLWSRANESMSTFDYQRLMMCNQLLRGNAYAGIVRDPRSGRPQELIPLPPDYVSPVFDDIGDFWYVFTHPVSGEMTLLRPEDVIHYKAYSEDGIEGVSVLKRASLTLSTARAAAQYENSTWLNGGQPCGILTTDSDLGGQVQRVQADGSTVWVDPKDQPFQPRRRQSPQPQGKGQADGRGVAGVHGPAGDPHPQAAGAAPEQCEPGGLAEGQGCGSAERPKAPAPQKQASVPGQQRRQVQGQCQRREPEPRQPSALPEQPVAPRSPQGGEQAPASLCGGCQGCPQGQAAALPRNGRQEHPSAAQKHGPA